jgi:hypothetical protein
MPKPLINIGMLREAALPSGRAGGRRGETTRQLIGPFALLGFGFMFVHPFEDGNGRIHRFLIHHCLAKLLSPAYDLLSTLPYIPGATLALNFGDSRSLAEIRSSRQC